MYPLSSQSFTPSISVKVEIENGMLIKDRRTAAASLLVYSARTAWDLESSMPLLAICGKNQNTSSAECQFPVPTLSRQQALRALLMYLISAQHHLCFVIFLGVLLNMKICLNLMHTTRKKKTNKKPLITQHFSPKE